MYYVIYKDDNGREQRGYGPKSRKLLYLLDTYILFRLFINININAWLIDILTLVIK